MHGDDAAAPPGWQFRSVYLELLYNLCARPIDEGFTVRRQREASDAVWEKLEASLDGDRSMAIAMLAWYADQQPPAAPPVGGVNAAIAFALGIRGGADARRAVRLIAYLAFNECETTAPAQRAWSSARLADECADANEHARLSAASDATEMELGQRALCAAHRWFVSDPSSGGAAFGMAWSIAHLGFLCDTDVQHEQMVRALVGFV